MHDQAIQVKLKLKERRSVISSVIDKLMKFIDKFSNF